MVVLETNLRRTEGKRVLQKKELSEKVQQRRSCKMKILKCISKRKVTEKKFQNSKSGYKNCKGECYTRTNRHRLLLRNFVYNTHVRKVHWILSKALLSESRIVYFLKISLVLYTILPQYTQVKAQSYQFKASDHHMPLIY